MAVRLRMAVHGLRHNRIFHIVAIDSRKRRNAKPIETLGMFDPRVKPGESSKTIEWSVERIKYWLGVGAEPSKTVTKLLTMGGIIQANSEHHKDDTYHLPVNWEALDHEPEASKTGSTPRTPT